MVDMNYLLNYFGISIISLELIYSIFNKYTKTILHLKKSTSNKIVLLNIYAPPNVKDYHNIIDLWNKKQKEFASKNNIKILDIHSMVNHKLIEEILYL